MISDPLSPRAWRCHALHGAHHKLTSRQTRNRRVTTYITEFWVCAECGRSWERWRAISHTWKYPRT